MGCIHPFFVQEYTLVLCLAKFSIEVPALVTVWVQLTQVAILKGLSELTTGTVEWDVTNLFPYPLSNHCTETLGLTYERRTH